VSYFVTQQVTHQTTTKHAHVEPMYYQGFPVNAPVEKWEDVAISIHGSHTIDMYWTVLTDVLSAMMQY
jgi:hypothetical protein